MSSCSTVNSNAPIVAARDIIGPSPRWTPSVSRASVSFSTGTIGGRSLRVSYGSVVTAWSPLDGGSVPTSMPAPAVPHGQLLGRQRDYRPRRARTQRLQHERLRGSTPNFTGEHGPPADVEHQERGAARPDRTPGRPIQTRPPL